MTISYSLSDFGHLTSPKILVANTILEGDLPSIDDVAKDARWDGIQKKVFGRTLEDFENDGRDRSRSLANLAHHGAELGWSDEQIYVVIADADQRWGKYSERHNREQILLDLINSARQKHGYEPATEFDIDKLLGGTTETPAEDRVGDDLGVMSIDDLNSHTLDLEWLMEGILHARGFGLLTGRQGTGKTQLALQLAACLATGAPRFLNWELPASGAKKVLVVSLEMGQYILKRFTEPLRENYPGPDIPKNMPILPLGQPLPLDTKEAQEYFDQVMERQQPDLVIIDSLETTASTELTDEGGVKPLMNYLSTLRDRYACALLIIHHHRKRSNEFASQKRPNSLYDVYGSNYITAKVDFVLDVDTWRNEKGDQPDKNRLTLNTLKCRLGPMMEHPLDIKRGANLHFTPYNEDLAARVGGELIDDFDTGIGF
jgi:hypothetical protein